MQFLQLVSLVMLLPALILAEVTRFKQCPQFFPRQGGQPVTPTILAGNQYKEICQKSNNQYEFATLYDTVNKIPVYSAYLYQGNIPCARKQVWMIEPQLDDQNGSPEMTSEGKVNITLRGKHQALNEDYERSGFDKGHLYPVFHTFQQCTADATFTLTNAVPQDCYLNRVSWYNDVEAKTKTFLDNNCAANFAYVVTGVVPGQGKINNRVNVPDYLWSAYCCLNTAGAQMHSGGFIVQNTNQGSIPNISVAALNAALTSHYNTQFSVFQNKC